MIGWYIHHHGRGHLTRAETIVAQVKHPVTAISSLREPDTHGFQAWLNLERDDADIDPSRDATAHGHLHWVPPNNTGLQSRTSAVAAWIAAARPAAMVVDVSVEISVLTALCGVPLVIIAGPGDRQDRAHQLAFGLAEAIIGAWSRDVYDPPFLQAHADRTHFVGAFSRFDGRSASAPGRARGDVVVLNGAGGSDLDAADVTAAQDYDGRRRWNSYGVGGTAWVDDVWEHLVAAEVIVTHGGQNALAEVAAAGRPAVIVPQLRPFAEQHRVAAALAKQGIAVSVPRWPAPSAWPGLIDSALALGGEGWQRWSSGRGAERAATVICDIADRGVR